MMGPHIDVTFVCSVNVLLLFTSHLADRQCGAWLLPLADHRPPICMPTVSKDAMLQGMEAHVDAGFVVGDYPIPPCTVSKAA